MVQAESLVDRVLDAEALTAGLEDPEARLLIEWLVEQTEQIARQAASLEEARQQVEQLCHYGRTLRRFLILWCYEKNPGGAAQLAATEKFGWPLPPASEGNAFAILRHVLHWHDQAGQTFLSRESGHANPRLQT